MPTYTNISRLPALDRFRIHNGRLRLAKKQRNLKERHMLAIAELLRGDPDAWGDIDYITRKVGISERSYFRYIKEMKQRGFCPTCGRLVAGLDEDEQAE